MKFKRRRIFIFLAMSASLLMITPFCLFAFNGPSRFHAQNEHPRMTTGARGSMAEERNPPVGTASAPAECLREPKLSRCEVIHVAIVCTGFGSSRDVATLVKSLLFHRKNRLHLHFLSDFVAAKILGVLFDTWMIPAVSVTFYGTEDLKERVEWIPNKHYSGLNGLMKLLVPDVLPQHLERVIVLDTDITVMADIGELWTVFEKFEKGQVIGLVDNQSNWYLQKGNGVQVWPALGTGYNTGVILFDLEALRSLDWNATWSEATRKHLLELHVVHLADQDIFNAVIHEDPSLVHRVPCSWNVQLGEKTLSDLCYNNVDPKIIHWNSPKKLKVKAKNAEHFRNLFLTFLEYNGNLLRQDFILDCSGDADNNRTADPPPALGHPTPPLVDDGSDDPDECSDFRRESLMTRRTHPYYLDYATELIRRVDLGPPDVGSSPPPPDVTLVVQLSMERLQSLEALVSAWPGPISLALHATDAGVHRLLRFVSGSTAGLAARRNVGYHVVFEDGQYYPINYLRNVALENVNTRFAFLSDADFLPVPDLYESLKRHVLGLVEDDDNNNRRRRRALVVPAFETERYKAEYPSSKSQLLDMLNAQELFTFRYHVWPQGQAATNYTRWKHASEAYQVSWEPNYEPFIVIDRSAPRYDERFLGFGWNKVSHIMELDAMGYEFWVIPDGFILHLPHSPSLDIAKYRSSESYRYCLRLLKEDFLKYLSKKYGLKALKYLSPDS